MIGQQSKGHIPEQFIEELLERVSIAEFVKSYGVELKGNGRSLIARCPLPSHDDKTPSFNVIQDKNFCYCQGCGGGGDAIKFAMEMDKISFPEAVEKVANHLGLEIPRENSKVSQEASEYDSALRHMLSSAHGTFRSNLVNTTNPDINALIKTRGINNEMINRFGLGVANNSWDQIKNSFGAMERLKLLTDSGLAIYKPKTDTEKGKFYDRFRNGIVFPIRDPKGQVLSFSIRYPDGIKPKYINGPETQLFKKKRNLFGIFETLKENSRPEKLVIVEGYMDVIAMHQADMAYGVAPMGTALTDKQIQTLLRHSNDLTFCFDGDKAGFTAAKRALINLLPYINDKSVFRFCLLPAGEDPDSMIRKQGPKVFESHLAQAEPFSRFVFKMLFDGRDTKERESLAQLAVELSDILNVMPESYLKNDLAKQFQDLTGMPLTTSLNVKIAARNMSPNQIMSLTNDVRNVVAHRGNVNQNDIHVQISADHYKPASAIQRFVNQSSVISQSIPADASVKDKLDLLNLAMEQVVINTNLKVADANGMPLVQMITDAYQDLSKASDAEKRLALMAQGQLRNTLANHDMASLIHVISTEVGRINRLGKNICSKHQPQKQTVMATLSRFANSVADNVRYLDALGRFSPSEVYGQRYHSKLIELKGAITELQDSFPLQAQTQQKRSVSPGH